MRPAPLRLDTCAALWITQEELGAEGLIEEAIDGPGVHISPITAWEVGVLVSKGRLAVQLDPGEWFAELMSTRLRAAPMTRDILIASSSLPPSSLRDPADWILSATARARGFRPMTRDRLLLDFAQAGGMHAVAC